MSRKTKVTWTVKSREIVEFYCDGCGTHIGESIEYDDGFVLELGEFLLRFFVNGNWWTKHANFCLSCRKKFSDELVGELQELGFERGYT